MCRRVASRFQRTLLAGVHSHVLRFQPPPVEPDMRFSLIRLTDVLHRRHSVTASTAETVAVEQRLHEGVQPRVGRAPRKTAHGAPIGDYDRGVSQGGAQSGPMCTTSNWRWRSRIDRSGSNPPSRVGSGSRFRLPAGWVPPNGPAPSARESELERGSSPCGMASAQDT